MKEVQIPMLPVEFFWRAPDGTLTFDPDVVVAWIAREAEGQAKLRLVIGQALLPELQRLVSRLLNTPNTQSSSVKA